MTKKLKRPFVAGAVVREIWPKATDGEVDFLLWEFTGWPSFFHTDYPDDEIRVAMRKLKRTMFWRSLVGIRRYPDPIESQFNWTWWAKRKLLSFALRCRLIKYEQYHKYAWTSRQSRRRQREEDARMQQRLTDRQSRIETILRSHP